MSILECTDCGLTWAPRHSEEATCPRCASLTHVATLEAENASLREYGKVSGETRAEVVRLQAENAALKAERDAHGCVRCPDQDDNDNARGYCPKHGAEMRDEVDELNSDVECERDEAAALRSRLARFSDGNCARCCGDPVTPNPRAYCIACGPEVLQEKNAAEDEVTALRRKLDEARELLCDWYNGSFDGKGPFVGVQEDTAKFLGCEFPPAGLTSGGKGAGET